MTERSQSTSSAVHEFDAAQVPREPWRHLVTLIGVAVALFLLCVVVFYALERLL